MNKNTEIFNGTKKTNRKNKLKYIFFVILAGIGWGTSGIFVAALIKLGFLNMQIASLRCICACLSSLVFIIIINPNKFKVTLGQLLVCSIIGFAFFLMAYFYYTAMQKTSYSVASVLIDLAVLIVLFFSVIFLKEKLTLKKMFAALTALIGSALITGVYSGANVSWCGVGFAVVACLCYAAYSILSKIAVNMQTDTIAITIYCFLFASLISLFFVDPISSLKVALNGPWYTIPLLVAMGIFTGSLPGCLYSFAMTKLPAGTVSSVACVEPLVSTMLALLFLNEEMSILLGIGMAMIFVAISVISRETDF